MELHLNAIHEHTANIIYYLFEIMMCEIFILMLLIFHLQSVLKVIVPDEMQGSILTKTLPVRPHMTTKDVCKIIAHKAKITNPQDFALYRLVDGEGR